MQTARRVIDLVAELTAGVQRRENDLKGGFALVFRMGIDRDTTAVVLDREHPVGLQGYQNAVGVTCHRLVHGVVDDLGCQVVQTGFVGPSDIHAGASADGFETFQDFDVLGGILGVPLLRAFAVVFKQIVHRHGHPARLRDSLTDGCGGTL